MSNQIRTDDIYLEGRGYTNLTILIYKNFLFLFLFINIVIIIKLLFLKKILKRLFNYLYYYFSCGSFFLNLLVLVNNIINTYTNTDKTKHLFFYDKLF